jgi:hypothetical protein
MYTCIYIPFLVRLGLTRLKSESKNYIIKVLEMFDPGIQNLIDGEDIDRPSNAVTLATEYHRRFANLEVFFEATLDGAEHTYMIKSTAQYPWGGEGLPVERKLFMTPDRSVDMPSPRLLAIHRACALILHACGGGEYIDRILRDEDKGQVESDGSTELGKIISYRFRRPVIAT